MNSNWTPDRRPGHESGMAPLEHDESTAKTLDTSRSREAGPGPDSFGSGIIQSTGNNNIRRFMAAEWLFVIIVAVACLLLIVWFVTPEPADSGEDGLVFEEEGPGTLELMSRLDKRPDLKIFLALVGAFLGILIVAGVPLLGYFAWRHVNGDFIFGRAGSFSPPPWIIWDVLKCAALYLLMVESFGLIILSLFTGVSDDPRFALAVIFFANIVLVAFVMRLIAVRDVSWRQALGLAGERYLKHFRDAVLGYAATFPILVGLALISVLLAHLFGLTAEQNPLVPVVLESDSLWFMVFIFVFGAVVGPITEELFFRGFFYPALRRRLGPMSAVVINALCFAALHGNLVQLLPLFGLGFVLAVLRERSGSVYPSIVLHMGHNLMVLVILMVLKPILV